MNAVNISANRSYNPPCCEWCEFGYRVVGTLWILVNAVNTVNAVNISANRSYKPHTVNALKCCERCEFGYRVEGTLAPRCEHSEMLWTLWILVQTGQLTPHAVNAVNLSANRSSTQTHALNTVDSANAVNLSANRSYNPPTLWMLWILVQTGHITPRALNTVNLGTG